jgi:hypothetical protein
MRSPFAVRRSPFSVRRSAFAVRRSPFSVHRLAFERSLRILRVGLPGRCSSSTIRRSSNFDYPSRLRFHEHKKRLGNYLRCGRSSSSATQAECLRYLRPSNAGRLHPRPDFAKASSGGCVCFVFRSHANGRLGDARGLVRMDYTRDAYAP